jgi:hypothetical protein
MGIGLNIISAIKNKRAADGVGIDTDNHQRQEE